MNTEIILPVVVSTTVGTLFGYHLAYRLGRAAFRNLMHKAIDSTTGVGNAAASILVDELKIDHQDAVRRVIKRCNERGMNLKMFSHTGKEIKL